MKLTLRLLSAVASGLMVVILFAIVWSLVRGGIGEISIGYFFEETRDAGRAGGIYPVMISTLWIVGLTMVISTPLSIAVAVYLNEFVSSSPKGARFRTWVRQSLDILASVPSIVFGLFGYAFFSIALGLGFSILSGALTLTCMVLPILILAVDIGLQSTPHGIRAGSHSLGLSKFTLITKFLLPAALPSIAAGFVLGVGRAIAETAALIFTAGYVDRTPESVMDSGRALSVHIYDLAMNIPGADARANAAALTLLLILLALTQVTRYFSKRMTLKWVTR